ncbi:glycosyltransferase [Roseococcus pinisoli]|uniref:Glycosyltransferase n=1 Tax=Roseococcus pinisoli TaxID=2835040 RepID=A0ABS5QEX7_9PROT|nr:glycosyltransferase [Roseococcus pinisoli]MBS7812124.1 glycosyltransferase [Roseococcus pinisoli]
MMSVHVLLATYNGATHLPTQLESLAAQSDVDWHLLWRDDGSFDTTPAILESFAAAHPGRVTHLDDPRGRLGAGASFLALLAAAPAGACYAFMDQDDVWLPGKLARAAVQLGERPTIVCSRLRLVTAELEPIGLSPLPAREPSFATLLAHNIAAGCTMVMNGPARELALGAPLPERGFHDWWCALLVTGGGGRLVFDPEPLILYRQHGANVIGGASGWRHRARRVLSRGAEGFLGPLAVHLKALRQAHLSPEARRVVEAAEGLRDASPLRRLAALRRSGLAHHARGMGVLLCAWVAFRRLN